MSNFTIRYLLSSVRNMQQRQATKSCSVLPQRGRSLSFLRSSTFIPLDKSKSISHIHLNKLAHFQLQLFIRATVPVDRAEKRHIKVNVTLSRITFLFYLFSLFVFVIVKHIKWTHFENVE